MSMLQTQGNQIEEQNGQKNSKAKLVLCAEGGGSLGQGNEDQGAEYPERKG